MSLGSCSVSQSLSPSNTKEDSAEADELDGIGTIKAAIVIMI